MDAVEDLDGPKTVEEKVARQAKIRVFKQFSAGVVAYVTTTLAVIILPIFVSPDVRLHPHLPIKSFNAHIPTSV